jgi:uncharacterized protein YqcC (DUF446 family)
VFGSRRRRAWRERRHALEHHLDLVEAEMRRIGYWSDAPPDVPATTSFLDAPSFELWLQCVFLPNARERVKTGDLPEHSQVGLMAMRQYDYHSSVPAAHTLMRLLNDFDQLIESG